ncbi:MAG: rod shape-determining protein MreC [Coriobacteriia bacterium]|nr:rod shape-determining protein MreC [Coriobacteriia bacterium]
MKLPQSDRTVGNAGVLAILLVAAIVLMTMSAREGEQGMLHRTRKALQAATAPIASVGTWISTPVRAVTDWAGGLSVSRSEVDELQTQNEELRQRVAELEEARLENERLRTLVGFTEARKLEALGARVIARPTSSWESVIVIDRGTADGVEPGMPVLAPQGLLGQTVEVTEHSAKVRLIVDQRSGVAGMVQSTRAEGIVRGSVEGGLDMEYVSRETTVVAGDIVLTSGMGGVYPKGLLIGEVSKVDLPENALFSIIEVRPSARLQGVEEVIVLVGATSTADVGDGE